MATLHIALVPSRINKDGTHTLRVALVHACKTLYIATPYHVDKPSEFRNGLVVGRPDASITNAKLRAIIDAYERRLEKMPVNIYTCKQLRDLLTATEIVGSTTIGTFTRALCARLVEDGRKPYADNITRAVGNLLEFLRTDMPFDVLTHSVIVDLERWMEKRNLSSTTINLRMSNIKAVVNEAIDRDVVEYKKHPFAKYHLPEKATKDTCISLQEFKALRAYKPKSRGEQVAVDMFFLSFYLAGINFRDLIAMQFPKDGVLNYIRHKSQRSRRGEKRISITITSEAQCIIDKYIGKDLRLRLGYKFTKDEDLRRMLTATLKDIGERLEFEKVLGLNAARHTFSQFANLLGIPLYVIEYSVGHSIKDEANRPIFNYIQIMREQADKAIAQVIEYTK